MNIDQLRNDTPGTSFVTHFNNAGASLPTQYVNQAIISYLHEEETHGGYETADKYADKIKELYSNMANLIHADSDEIAITENASTAFSKALYSIDFHDGDEIITSEIEYGNNFLNYLNLRKRIDIKIITIPGTEDSAFDMELFLNSINPKTRLIAITHMPTNSGAIAPVEQIGEIAKIHNILYLVDTCQSIGHYPVYVDKIHCDFLTGTSRKYLRGPRGLGFLYVKKDILPQLQPAMLEMDGAQWNSSQDFHMIYSAKMFEVWEKSPALLLGMNEAVKYLLDIGIENVWSRINHLGRKLRNGLTDIKGIQLHDGPGELSGIISLTHNRYNVQEVKKQLKEYRINSSISGKHSSFSDMNKKGLEAVNRLSVHYYNSEQEIEKVLEVLNKLK